MFNKRTRNAHRGETTKERYQRQQQDATRSRTQAEERSVSPCCGSRLSIRGSRAVCMGCGAEGPAPIKGTGSFIPNWHDRNWKAGPPPAQLALYAEMEAVHSAYAGVR